MPLETNATPCSERIERRSNNLQRHRSPLIGVHTYSVNGTCTRKIKKTTKGKCNEKNKKATEETLQTRRRNDSRYNDSRSTRIAVVCTRNEITRSHTALVKSMANLSRK